MTVHRVVFAPSGLEAQVADGTSVLDAARSVGADLDSTCGGRGLCGRCQVLPVPGSFSKWQIESATDAVGDWTSTEGEYRGRRPLDDGRRLGCAARVRADLVVEIPEASQVHRPVVRKSVELGDLEVDPLVHLHYVEMQAGATPFERVRDALRKQFGVAVDTVEAAAEEQLDSSRDAEAVTVAVRRGAAVCSVSPGYADDAYGVAIDVGSTTVAGHLVDLSSGEVVASHGLMNPQIRFGDDLMSRVSYVMMNTGGAEELTGVIRAALDELVGALTTAAGTSRNRLFDMVIVGNPVMHHIVLGLDPTPLGQAPFPLATDGAVLTRATDLQVDAPHAEAYLLPCIAGHVGADTAAAILAEGPHRSGTTQLIVDVGTNAEIVLGDEHGLYAASSPTGPAFEGAQIAAGQRATTGAIERVRIDRDTLEPRVRIIGSDHWSDEEGFASDAERLAVTGICGSGIIEVVGELFLAGVIATDGTIRGELAERTTRVVPHGRTFAYRLHELADGDDIVVTQDDVRAIQLAKAALRAGVDLLVERAAINDDDIATVRLAGAFGAHIDPLYAKVLGLVPDVPVDRIRSVGNSAGAGAVRALLSASQRREVEKAVAGVTKVETAVEPRFQELFVDAMGFPHTTAPSPNLATETTLPATPVGAESARRTRRSRRSRNHPSHG